MIKNGVTHKLREISNDIEATMAEGVQGCDCYATAVGSTPLEVENYHFLIFLFLRINFYIWHQDRSHTTH